MKRVFKLPVVSIVLLLIVAAIAIGCSSGNGVENAVFELKYAAEQGGYIDGDTEQKINFGKDGSTVYAVATDGYVFDCWSDGSRLSARTDKNIGSDITVVAVFKKRSFAVKYAAENGRIQGNGEQIVEYGENAGSVKAILDEGYEFVEWSDGTTDAVRTDNNIRNHLSVAAVFKKRSFAVKYAAEQGGYIDGDTEQKINFGKDGSTVYAVATDGYVFDCWSDGSRLSARTDKNIGSDITVVAVFKKRSFAVKYAAENGRIQGNGKQIVEYGENAGSVKAIPDEGYEFVKWSDGVKTAERIDLNIKNDINVIACFGYRADIESSESPSEIRQADESVESDETEIVYATYDFIIINDTDCSARIANKSEATIAIISSTAMINGAEYNVTEIASSGFSSSPELLQVILPDTVKKIGSNAFARCEKLNRIDLANIEEIGSAAFYKCTELTEITIPRSVRRIGNYAFRQSGIEKYT